VSDLHVRALRPTPTTTIPPQPCLVFSKTRSSIREWADLRYLFAPILCMNVRALRPTPTTIIPPPPCHAFQASNPIQHKRKTHWWLGCCKPGLHCCKDRLRSGKSPPWGFYFRYPSIMIHHLSIMIHYATIITNYVFMMIQYPSMMIHYASIVIHYASISNCILMLAVTMRDVSDNFCLGFYSKLCVFSLARFGVFSRAGLYLCVFSWTELYLEGGLRIGSIVKRL